MVSLHSNCFDNQLNNFSQLQFSILMDEFMIGILLLQNLVDLERVNPKKNVLSSNLSHYIN